MAEGTVERIGGYRIVRRIATGGTSDVLLAKAEGPYGFERTVVLKLLLTKFREDESFARMFAREATAYARLNHPSIVRLYDFFSHAGALVMVLEHVDGPPLHKLRTMLKNAGAEIDDEAALHIGARLFAALAAAHSARDPDTGALAPVMHRDVNPSNVLIPWEGYVKLADFGIAKVAGMPSDTQVGLIKGTYGYMAPEQVRGENVTIRADVYAGAIVLWELFARRKAIYGGALPEVEILKAMIALRGVYERHQVVSLNHGVGFDTAAIELILPTYGEQLGLKGRVAKHWVLNPHPTLIPAIESGWVESIHSFGGESGMNAYVAARPDAFFTGADGSTPFGPCCTTTPGMARTYSYAAAMSST